MKVAYERVTVRDHEGRVESIDLVDVTTSAAWLVGQEVDRSGDRVGRQRLIAKSAVLERIDLRIDLKYGRLRTTR